MRLRVIAPAGVLVLAVVGLVIASRGSPGPQLQVGELYSVQMEEQNYGVAKILALDEAVHFRVYKERFRERPLRLNESTLTHGSVRDRDGLGFEHIPLSRGALAAWKPVFIQASVVRADELVAYEEWKRSGGGVWK